MLRLFITLSIATLLSGSTPGCRHPNATRSPTSPQAGTPRAPVPGGGTTITFTKKHPGVGSIRTSKEMISMDVTLTVGDRSLRMERAQTEETTEVVLARSGDIMTRMKVTYLERTTIEKVDGKEQVKKSPLAGKSFILEMRDGQRVALDGAGKPLPEKDARRVLKQHRSFGKPDAMLAALPTTPLKAGDRVEALAEGLRKDLAEDTGEDQDGQKTSVEGVSVTLKEIRTEREGKVGVFDIAVTFKLDQGNNLTMTMTLKGTVTLRERDGWPTTMRLEGPISVMGQANSGGMVMSKTMTYGGR